MRIRQILITLTVLAMSVASLSASGVQDAADAAAAGDGIARISILNDTSWPIPSGVDVNDNVWANIYREGLPDIEIDWIMVPTASMEETKNILIATGNMPDVMHADDLEMVRWADQGLIRPLDDLVADYFPNQEKWLTEDDLRLAFYQGRQYRLLMPSSPLENTTTLYVRSDWLDKFGLDVPRTLDEAHEAMRLFTFGDPNESGRDDTFGVIARANLESLRWAFNAFGVQEPFWSEVDGEIVPDIVRPQMKDALAFIRELYSSGVLYQDSLVFRTNAQVEEIVTQGTIGFTESPPSFGIATRVRPSLQSRGMDMIPIEPLIGPEGEQMYPSGPAIWGRPNAVIAASSRHPEAAVRVFNWLLDEDTSVPYNSVNADRINAGTPGVHSEVAQPGNFLLTLPQSQLTPEQAFDVYRLSYRLMGGYLHLVGYEALAAIRDNGDAIRAVAPYVRYNDKVLTGPVEAELFGELKTYYDELKMQIITGRAPLDAFDRWVDYFYQNGGREIVAEANALRN